MVNYELIEKAVKNGERIPAEAITFTYYDPKDYMGGGQVGHLRNLMICKRICTLSI